MNDAELQRLLAAARVPERPADYWQDFPAAVLRRLSRPPEHPATEARSWPRPLRWSLALGTACLVIGFALGFWRARSTASDSAQLAHNLALLRELQTMFPNSIRALVTDDSGARIVLSDRPDVPASAPLLIRLCRGRQCQSIITFSGQTVDILGLRVEVLVDAQGQVWVVGDNEVWSGAEPKQRLGRLRVEAKALDIL